MRLNLGYLLLSKAVSQRLERERTFVDDFAMALQKHLKSGSVSRNSLIPGALENGAQLKTYFGDLIVITERDREHKPRTTVVLWDERGV